MSFITLKVAIKFPRSGRYLAIDGNGMSSFAPPGAGSVTGSMWLERLSILYMDQYVDGTISIRVPDHPGVFLRISPGFFNGSYILTGGGTVNCQYSQTNLPHPDGNEFFRLRSSDGWNMLESALHPGLYLRMDENGQVNCQWWGTILPPSSSWECFRDIHL